MSVQRVQPLAVLVGGGWNVGAFGPACERREDQGELVVQEVGRGLEG